MGRQQGQEKVLIDGLVNKQFAEAMIELLDTEVSQYKSRFDAAPRGGFEDESMNMFINRGGIIAVNKIKQQLQQLIETALQQR